MNENQAGWVIGLLIVVIGLLCGEIWVALFAPSELQTWKYTIVAPDDTNLRTTMREMGNKGWEISFARRVYDSSTETAVYEMIFKQPMKGE